MAVHPFPLALYSIAGWEDGPLPQGSLLAVIDGFLLSTRLLSTLRFPKMERVEGSVGGACSAVLKLKRTRSCFRRLCFADGESIAVLLSFRCVLTAHTRSACAKIVRIGRLRENCPPGEHCSSFPAKRTRRRLSVCRRTPRSPQRAVASRE